MKSRKYGFCISSNSILVFFPGRVASTAMLWDALPSLLPLQFTVVNLLPLKQEENSQLRYSVNLFSAPMKSEKNVSVSLPIYPRFISG